MTSDIATKPPGPSEADLGSREFAEAKGFGIIDDFRTWIESDEAATRLPAAKTTRPPTMTGTRPTRSDSAPSGTCRIACVRP